MIPVLLSIAIALGVLFAGFNAQLSRVSALRVRAQLAADAAALAAIAESGPYGRGRHELEAGRIARANGARLLACSCRPGSSSSEVTVTVDDVVAKARAVLEVGALAPASVGFDHRGLHPRLAAAAQRLIRESRGAVRVVSGYRSSRRQAQLWAGALRKYGSPEIADDWVAPPARSMHERGLAVDLGGDLEMAARLISELGLPLHRPLSNEPWHFELVGSRSAGGA